MALDGVCTGPMHPAIESVPNWGLGWGDWMLFLWLDFFASLGTVVAYRCVEQGKVPWWRRVIVSFLAYQGGPCGARQGATTADI